jgi:hypothetical protein
MNNNLTELISDIRNTLPSDRVILPAPEDRDTSRLRAEIRPETSAELTTLLEICRNHELYVRAPGDLCPVNLPFVDLNFSRLSRILDLDTSSQLVTAQGGVPTGELESWLDAYGWTLGWYTSDLENVPINVVIQQGRTGFPSPKHLSAQDAIMGFRAILPTGREAWHHTGPRRATGPDLTALLKSTMGFGILTRVVLQVHPQTETRTIHRINSNDINQLLSLAGHTARSHGAPNQLFIVKHFGDNRRKKKNQKDWSLFVVWAPTAQSQTIFLDRVRFRGLRAHQETVSKVDIMDELTPGLHDHFVRLSGRIPEPLQIALEKTRNRWVMSFKSAHDLYLWPAHEHKSKVPDPVSVWCQDRGAAAIGNASALRNQLLKALDPQGLMHLSGAQANSVFDSKSIQED